MASSLLDTEPLSETEEEENEEEPKIESWDDWGSDEDESSSDYLCLFCVTKFDSTKAHFDHCRSQHSFDFHKIVKDLVLDFYGSMKLINYVRSQVAECRCWSCGINFELKSDLLKHLHPAASYEKGGELLWDDEKYLKPFMVDDTLLHSFVSDDEDEEDDTETICKEEVIRELMNGHDNCENDDIHKIEIGESSVENMGNGAVVMENTEHRQKANDKQLRVSFANVAAREIKNVNDKYFGSYGSFGIHREMISDKIRTDAYRDAILYNPSLLKQATVLDVGCGTGILSLFAAQAGASRVIAVEASTKMAAVATQIAKDNGFLSGVRGRGEEKQCSEGINVVKTMVEDLDKRIQIQPNSVDVLVSEWMGYCLLYESMLSSVLYARDHWLKPGGAILPDTATIFIAGFGRGGTSLPFWENVYGFNMSCIGKEVVEDAAKAPIVDVVESRDIVTESTVIKFFDLATMRPSDMDFTATSELVPKSNDTTSTCWCHGIVLWFDTGFTTRFCKEKPVNLTTSPYSTRTHWSQTIFTFQEPIALASAIHCDSNPVGAVGTEDCPVVKIKLRISIVRSSQYRSIDISMETAGISSDGRKRSWPVQIFNL